MRSSCESQRPRPWWPAQHPGRPFNLALAPFRQSRMSPVKETRSYAIPMPIPLLLVADDSRAWTPLEAVFQPPTLPPLARLPSCDLLRSSAAITPGFLSAPWRISRRKYLVPLRFPASASRPYKCDAVTLCESHQAQSRPKGLWISWISWIDSPIRFAALGMACARMNTWLFQVHETELESDALRSLELIQSK